MAAETPDHATVPVETAAEHAATHAAEPGASTEHASGGLPQFEFQHWGGQIAYLLILFAILYFLMSRVFGPRIRKVFDEREESISGALASARAVQEEANAQAKAAQDELAAARASAQRTAVEAKAKAHAEAAKQQAAQEEELNARLAEAEAQIKATADRAMANVGDIARDTAAAIVEKLTGKTATAAELARRGA